MKFRLRFRDFATYFVCSFCFFAPIGLFGNETSITPILQPGAPGQDSREISAEEAIQLADTSFSSSDVDFMQRMIPHHRQAVEMAALVEERTNREEIVDLAARIDKSQLDEIEFMTDWLQSRGQSIEAKMSHHSMMMDMKKMGMATEEQMTELRSSKGTDFDRTFLQLMIRHHKGAITMVEDLLDLSGTAFEEAMFEFVNDLTNDQETEIERMSALARSLNEDPRTGLAAGFLDAEIAISNLELMGSLPKPPGFYDPNNPAELPLKLLAKRTAPKEQDDGEEDSEASAELVSEESEDSDEEESEKYEDDRYPLLSFSNTDMAFKDDVMVVGNYHGFNVYRLHENAMPSLVSSVICPGGQGDVSIVGHLLILSVEQTRGRVDCGRDGVSEKVSEERFRGLRIFDLSDITRPRQVGQVQTCRGSHTHSVVSGPDEDGMIVVYNSGTSEVREEEELAGCIGNIAGDQRTALFRIDVIEIPIDSPGDARIVDSPGVFADEETGVLAGLWRGGDHGGETQDTRATDQCHDITVFPATGIAAGACSGNGIVFDIADPRKPKRIDDVLDKGFAYWHSATFNNDGDKVIFTDEWGGGGRARCRTHDPLTWGADAIYDIVDGKLEFRSHFKMPAPQTDEENCVAHNGSIIPIPGRDIFLQAWYQGGISIFDFTDSSNPQEIAFFDRGPIDDEALVSGGFWSTYWYDGKIYGTGIVRGLDVFELLPSEHISENEIAAAKLASQGNIFNPQQQLKVSWPANPVVASAHLDQLIRSKSVSVEKAQDLRNLLDRVVVLLKQKGKSEQLAESLRSVTNSWSVKTKVSEGQLSGLRQILIGISERLIAS